MSLDERCKIQDYVNHIRDLASGKRPTVATLLRQMVQKDPNYAKDSVITPEIQTSILNKYKEAMSENKPFT